MTSLTHIHNLIEPWIETVPDGLALIDFDGRKMTFGELGEAVGQAGDCLRQLGVRPGDRVALISENCIATVAFLFAASQLSAWAIPVNARLSTPEIERIIAHASPRAIMFTHRASENADAHADHWCAHEHTGVFGAARLAGPLDADAEPVSSEPAKQVAVLLYTTGTTGDPKGVMLSHQNLISAAKMATAHRSLTPDDWLYLVLPITHVFGLTSVMMAALYAGASVQLVPRFDPKAVLEAIGSGITSFPGVPQMHAHIMSYAASQNIDRLRDNGLRYISSGGAPLDPDWKARVEAFFGLPLFNGYGLTETTAGVAATNATNTLNDISVGKALSDDIEIKLDQAAGNEEGIGEIVVRGPVIMRGYYRNPAATRMVLDDDGWFRTGDLGRFDKAGNLHIAGRTKELIIRSGFNVYPQEVEAAINEHDEVIQCVVAGRQLDDGNEEVIGFIEVRENRTLTEEDLNRFLKDRLAPYKRPGQLIFTTKLPAAATGKVLRSKLIDIYATQLKKSNS